MPCLFLVPSRRLCNNTCNGVLKRLVPCLKCMELAYWYSVLCGEHKNEKIWQKIFDQTVSFTFPKIHEFGGPPVVPSKKFGCPFIKLHRRFKGICHCQIHMPVLVMYLLPNLLLKDESRKQVLDLKVCSKLLLPPKSTNLSSA